MLVPSQQALPSCRDAWSMPSQIQMPETTQQPGSLRALSDAVALRACMQDFGIIMEEFPLPGDWYMQGSTAGTSGGVGLGCPLRASAPPAFPPQGSGVLLVSRSSGWQLQGLDRP